MMDHRRIQAMMMESGQTPQYLLDAYIASLNPTLWIAARKETTYVDSDAVPTATDWSGNGYDATQGVTANQPTYVSDGIGGLPTFSFGGVNDFLQSTGWTNAQPNTIVAVAKYNHPDLAGRNVVNGASSSGYNLLAASAGSWIINAGLTRTDGADDTNPNVFSALYNGALSHLYLNGSLAISNNAGPLSMIGATIGANFIPSGFWDGNISEVFIKGSALSEPQRQKLETLLGAAYNITITH